MEVSEREMGFSFIIFLSFKSRESPVQTTAHPGSDFQHHFDRLTGVEMVIISILSISSMNNNEIQILLAQ